jgi:hypothetical protein
MFYVTVAGIIITLVIGVAQIWATLFTQETRKTISELFPPPPAVQYPPNSSLTPNANPPVVLPKPIPQDPSPRDPPVSVPQQSRIVQPTPPPSSQDIPGITKPWMEPLPQEPNRPSSPTSEPPREEEAAKVLKPGARPGSCREMAAIEWRFEPRFVIAPVCTLSTSAWW